MYNNYMAIEVLLVKREEKRYDYIKQLEQKKEVVQDDFIWKRNCKKHGKEHYY